MKIIENLQSHVQILSQDIGIRSILEPEQLEAAALYIESEFESAGLHVVRQPLHEPCSPGTMTGILTSIAAAAVVIR